MLTVIKKIKLSEPRVCHTAELGVYHCYIARGVLVNPSLSDVFLDPPEIDRREILDGPDFKFLNFNFSWL